MNRIFEGLSSPWRASRLKRHRLRPLTGSEKLSSDSNPFRGVMRDWLSFWNSPNRIYVNDRHRDVHYRDVALQVLSLIHI